MPDFILCISVEEWKVGLELRCIDFLEAMDYVVPGGHE